MVNGLGLMILALVYAVLLVNMRAPEILDEIIDGLMGRNEEEEEEKRK